MRHVQVARLDPALVAEFRRFLKQCHQRAFASIGRSDKVLGFLREHERARPVAAAELKDRNGRVSRLGNLYDLLV